MSIMIYFAVNLHAAGFKFPYSFLLILITSVLTLLNLIFTTLLYCRNSLRPTLSLITGTILLILWALSLGFLGYSMRGTLHTTCNTASWGTSTGVMVCRVYKVLFSFIVVALAFTFIHIVIDGAARKDQTNLDTYDSMHYREDYKLHARGESGIPLAAASSADAVEPVIATAGVEDELRSAAGARADAFNALGTVRHDDTVYNSSSAAEYQNYHQQQQHQQQHQENDYYDGIPDVPSASGVRWASAAAPYSPLETRFDQQQSGYESYRPHQTPYAEGGYGYRG